MKLTQQEKAEYGRKRKEFLAANPWCAVAALRGEQVPATHVHHRRGRGQFYLDESTFVPASREGDEWIHTNEQAARQAGLLE